QIAEAKQEAAKKHSAFIEADKARSEAEADSNLANKESQDSQAALTSAKDKLKLSKDNLKTANKERDGVKASIATARNGISDVETEIKTLNELKGKLATDKTDLGTKQTELANKTGTIDTLESEAEALETKAAPHREKLKEELAIVDAGKIAAKDKVKTKAEKDRYDAHGEDIERRKTTLAKKLEIRDQLSDSDLVKNFDKTVSDFETIAGRVDAMEWLRHRGLAEDTVFELKQSASLDLYLELVNEAERKAINILSPLCAEYSKFKLNKDEAKSALLRSKLLSTLWRLYYSSEELAETAGITCYYVAVKSGANVETFKTIDLKWKEALSRTLDKKTFKLASKLESTDLAVTKQTEE
ncbi:MAG: hypothetical protein L3J82_01750, partial [Planctomycetes bacterium]|nr:hypothetical protein [Planctomycetota bacterium]